MYYKYTENNLTVNKKILIRYITVLLTGQRFIDLLSAIKPYLHWSNVT